MIDLVAYSLLLAGLVTVGYWYAYSAPSQLYYLLTRVKARKKIKPKLIQNLREIRSYEEGMTIIGRYDPELYAYLERHGPSKAFLEYFIKEMEFMKKNAPKNVRGLLDAFMKRYGIVNAFLSYYGKPEGYPLKVDMPKVSGEQVGKLRLMWEHSLLKKFRKAADGLGDEDLRAVVDKYIKLCEFRFLVRKKMRGEPYDKYATHLIHKEYFRQPYQQSLKAFVEWFLKKEGFLNALSMYQQNPTVMEIEKGLDQDFTDMFQRISQRKPMSTAYLFLYLLKLDGYLSQLREIMFRLRWKEWRLL